MPESLQNRVDSWDDLTADIPQAAVRMDELFSDVAKRLSITRN